MGGKGGMHGSGACMVWGMCGRVHAWRGACMTKGCMAGGMCGRGHEWQGACMAGGYAWQGACVTGGMHGRAHMPPQQILRDTVNERVVRILLECILV